MNLSPLEDVMARSQSIDHDQYEPIKDSEARYQRALLHFQSDARTFKRGMTSALFIQRFRRGLTKPVSETA